MTKAKFIALWICFTRLQSVFWSTCTPGALHACRYETLQQKFAKEYNGWYNYCSTS